MAASEIVNVRIDSHSASGVERLDDVIRQMKAMVGLLSEFANDPDVSKVEVLSLQKNSPLTARLRMVTVRTAPAPRRGQPARKPVVRALALPIRRLERIYEVAVGARKTRGFDGQGLLALSDCAKQLRGDVATIETANRTLVISRAIVDQINDKLGSVKRSFGSVAGVLEGLNVHANDWHFTIYPEIGPKKIRCYFDESLLPEVQRSIKQRVVVHGLKEYVLDSALPVRVRVQSIEPSREAEPGSWLTLVNELSNAWESASEDERNSVLQGWAA